MTNAAPDRAERADGLYQGEAAIKLLRDDVASSGLAARFARERALLGRVAHPGIARLLDFGIAGLLDDAGHQADHQLTQLAGRRLTPAYAAPEQITGEAVGVASDMYSLGLMLSELASGRLPFGRRGLSRTALEHAVLHGHARRITQAASGAGKGAGKGDDAGPGSPPDAARAAGDLAAVAAKAMRRCPAERYASVGSFIPTIFEVLQKSRAELAQRFYKPGDCEYPIYNTHFDQLRLAEDRLLDAEKAIEATRASWATAAAHRARFVQRSRQHLWNIQARLGRPEGSVKNARQLIADMDALLGPGNSSSQRMRADLARQFVEPGRYAQAVQVHEELVARLPPEAARHPALRLPRESAELGRGQWRPVWAGQF